MSRDHNPIKAEDVRKPYIPVPETKVPQNKPQVSTELENPLNEPEATTTTIEDLKYGPDDEDLDHAEKSDVYPNHTNK